MGRSIYFHCSSTLAQALTMCIVVRFSCPEDYMRLIQQENPRPIRDSHIPTSGLVLGIERDPRHQSLLRMFLERRNEILDDMVICECISTDILERSVVHQEVHDGGSSVAYRLTLLHADGTRQSACLRISSEQLDDDSQDSQKGNPRMSDDPSTRFPITPCSSRCQKHTLPASNRILVYTGVSQKSETHSSYGEDSDSFMDLHTEGTTDDFVSTGGHSDNEVEQYHSTASVGAGARFCPTPTRIQAPAESKVEWRRPLVESVVLLSKMDEPPFHCDLAEPS